MKSKSWPKNIFNTNLTCRCLWKEDRVRESRWTMVFHFHFQFFLGATKEFGPTSSWPQTPCSLRPRFPPRRPRKAREVWVDQKWSIFSSFYSFWSSRLLKTEWKCNALSLFMFEWILTLIGFGFEKLKFWNHLNMPTHIFFLKQNNLLPRPVLLISTWGHSNDLWHFRGILDIVTNCCKPYKSQYLKKFNPYYKGAEDIFKSATWLFFRKNESTVVFEIIWDRLKVLQHKTLFSCTIRSIETSKIIWLLKCQKLDKHVKQRKGPNLCN